jgi:hypothetical protein
VSFLCMPAASYVSGQVICIDGGRTITGQWRINGVCCIAYWSPSRRRQLQRQYFTLTVFICWKLGTDKNVPNCFVTLCAVCFPLGWKHNRVRLCITVDFKKSK